VYHYVRHGSEDSNLVEEMNTENKRRARKLVVLFIVAVVLNYVWESAQAPLYAGLKSYNIVVFWHCLVASLGDGLMVMLIFAAGWIALHRWNWFEHPGRVEYLIMLSAGLALAVSVEWIGVHITRRWEYTESMPILPGIDLGIVPIAQMLVLPPLIFRIVTVGEKLAK